jgi:hypothetical protein
LSTVLEVAAQRNGIPYGLPPDPRGISSIDCSLYVVLTFRDAGLPFPPGVRTAEQIRQRCTPVAFGAAQPGDLLFFEHTYEPAEAPGPDGHVASHVGISLGTGSRQMWDANDGRGNVGITNITTDYWQEHIFQAARPNHVQATPAPAPPANAGQIRAVDVSSHQTPSLAALKRWIAEGCQLLIVKSYQRAESGLAQTTRAHVANAQAAGCWTLPYVWLYRSVDPRESVRTSLELFRSTGENPGIIFLDCETYTNPNGSLDPGPNVDQIMAAKSEAESLGVAVALYTGAWWLSGHLEGDKSKLAGWPAWLANYSKPPSLDWPAPLGMRLIGHQYQGSPLDWSLFDLAALTELQTPGDPTTPPVDSCDGLKIAVNAELAVIRAAMRRIEALVS